jgi:hypothetical protein
VQGVQEDSMKIQRNFGRGQKEEREAESRKWQKENTCQMKCWRLP